MRIICLSLAIAATTVVTLSAQVNISSLSTTTTITFDSTLAGVSNGQFAGAGFQPSPSTGQLDSDAWAVTGWSDGALAFGGTRTTTSDYARGSVTAAVTTGGIYAQGSTDRQLMIQPGGSDWAPGTLTLKIQNNTGFAMSTWNLGYELYVRNDQGRSNSFNFSYSTDDINYTSVTTGNFAYTSAAAADASPVWALISTLSTSVNATVSNNGYLYIRWSGADVGGSGSRDEFGLDDIAISAVPESNQVGVAVGALLGVLILMRRRKAARMAA